MKKHDKKAAQIAQRRAEKVRRSKAKAKKRKKLA